MSRLAISTDDPSDEITAIQITPSYLHTLIEDERSQEFLRNLRHLIVGGEKMPNEILGKLLVRTAASLFNMYGPTETTIWSTVKTIHPGEPIVIGKPIVNTRIYILDDHKELCPIGVFGNLYIGGAGVARGYLNRGELTKDRFVYDPFTDNPANRIYKTGDIARWLPNGDIEISGRTDDQIKIRGYRVEPGEIEYFIDRAKGIKKSVVALKEDQKGDHLLVGYLITEEGFDEELMFDMLREKLPEYMIPSVLMKVKDLPLTLNGKIR